MIISIACAVAIAVIAFILTVRPGDVPPPEPVSPFQHLDERKAAIYENLRDLQFEYRVGKLSDEDYQTTKKDLQQELARVLAEVDKLRNGIAPSAPAPAPRAAKAGPAPAPASKIDPGAKATAAANPVAEPMAAFHGVAPETNGTMASAANASGPAEAVLPAGSSTCPHCGASFQVALKFCGECGKPMKVAL